MYPAFIGTRDLNQPPYSIVGGDYKKQFPEARLTDVGRVAQRARGGEKREQDYEDAPWELSVFVDPVTEADMDALVSDFHAGEPLMIGGATGNPTAIIVDVDVVARLEVTSDAVIVTFGGTRLPGWRRTPVPFSLTVAGGRGYASLPDAEGTLGADIDCSAVAEGAATVIALGVRPEPSLLYDPVDYNYVGA